MNSKLRKKIILDIIMVIIMILLMEYSFTGALLHEILGIVVLGLFLLHFSINLKVVIQILKASKRKSAAIWLKLIMDILLIIMTVIMGISSVMISKYLFVFLPTNGAYIWKYLHTASAYGLLILIAVHTGFHWKVIMSAFRKMLHLKEKNRVRTVLLRIFAFILAVLGVKASFDRGIGGKFIPEIQNDPATTVKQESVLDATSFDGSLVATSSQTQIAANVKGGHGGPGGETQERTFTDTPPADGEDSEDYLGRLICTGCGKHCSLLSPQCGTGENQAAQAIEYFESYNNTDSEEEIETEESDTEDSSDADTDTEISTDDSQSADTESLSDYLGKLICTGCGKQCSLLAPRCSIGEEQALAATEEYESQSDSSTTDESSVDEGTTGENESAGEIVFTADESLGESLLSLFGDYVPIMGLYIAAGYYSLELMQHARKKKTGRELERDAENNAEKDTEKDTE